MRQEPRFFALSAATLFLALATPAGAQGVSASESYIELAHATAAAGGSGQSDLHQSESGAGYAVSGPKSASANYQALSGVVWIDSAGLGSGPVILSVLADQGDKLGGDSVQVIGLHLDSPGGGSTAVEFDGVAATGVAVVSDTQIDVVTPPGLSPLGNPKGPVTVKLENDLGSSELEGGFKYLPALVLENPAVPGQKVYMGKHGTPGASWKLYLGTTFPGTGMPYPPFEGSLELLANIMSLGPMQHSTSSYHQTVLTVPNNPALSGLSFDFQALEFSSFAPLAGSFTNVLTVTVE